MEKYTQIDRTQLLQKTQRNTVTLIASGGLYTRWLWISIDHAHKIRTVPWLLKARTIAVVNVLVQKEAQGKRFQRS